MLDLADIQKEQPGRNPAALCVRCRDHEALSQWLMTGDGARGLADTENFADAFGGNRRVGRR